MANLCDISRINTPTVGTLTVDDGATNSITFTDAGDTASDRSLPLDYCGFRTYEVQKQSDSSVVDWVTVSDDSAGTITIEGSPVSTNTEL